MNDPIILPRVRRPALRHGNLTYLNLSSFAGRWTVLCVLNQFRLLDVLFLNQHEARFAEEQVILAALAIDGEPFHQPWVDDIPPLDIPLIADPLGKASRRFGISRSWKNGKIHSVIFDSHGTRHAHLIHELNGRGMAFVMEMVTHGRSHTRWSLSQGSLEHTPSFLSRTSSKRPIPSFQEDQQYVAPCRTSSE